MRIAQHASRRSLGFNMTPMIDVVFLLIIFFLVSSHLARQETQLDLPLPVADSGEQPPETAPPRITFNILRDGTVLLAGRSVARDQLRERLAAAVAEAGEDVEIRIRSDRDVAYDRVEPLLMACARSGIWNVTFGVFHSEDVR